jgi:hypothetical protein
MSGGEAPVLTFVRVPRILLVSFAILAILGAVDFIVAVSGKESLRAWQAYLVNFIFWTGMAFGAVLFAAVLNITGARWGRPLKRLAEGFAAFLPVSFVLFWVLYPGRAQIFYWVTIPDPHKAPWLNTPFLFIRDGASHLGMTALALGLVFYSVKGDLLWAERREAREITGEQGMRWALTWRRQQILSPAFAIAAGFLLSLMGFDLVMSLDPHWYSTLLGGYFFVGCFYSGLAALYFISMLLRKVEPLREHLQPRQFHDLGKLVMAFCLLTGYLFYAQFLTIWYGNLPQETRYMILRVKLTPWEPLAWGVLFTILIGPFFILLSRHAKIRQIPVIVVSMVIMTGMWLERFILVAPSLVTQGSTIPIGFTEAFITAGFLGIVGLCITIFLQRVPLVPVSDPLFRQMQEKGKQRLEP